MTGGICNRVSELSASLEPGTHKASSVDPNSCRKSLFHAVASVVKTNRIIEYFNEEHKHDNHLISCVLKSCNWINKLQTVG
jgi:hypothetical protein